MTASDAQRSFVSNPGEWPVLPTIPRRRYIDKAFYQAEIDSVFRKSWLLVGHDSEFAEPGSYRLLDVPFTPVFIIKGVEGELRAFINSCRHRGASLLTEKEGCTRLLRCQYHGWSYNLEGMLKGITDPASLPNLDKSDYPLLQLRCEKWGKFVFINFDQSAPPLNQWLGPIASRYQEMVDAPLRVVARNQYSLNCNWKIAYEAFRESYHLSTIHKDTLAPMVNGFGGAAELYENGHNTLYATYHESLLEQMQKHEWQQQAQHSTLPPLPGADRPEIQGSFMSSSVFPNANLPFQPTGMPVLNAWPISVDECRLDMTWYGMDWGEGAVPEEWLKTLEAFEVVMAEDTANLGFIQQSIYAAPDLSMPLSIHETLIYQMHAEIDRMIGQANIPEGLAVAQTDLPHALTYSL